METNCEVKRSGEMHGAKPTWIVFTADSPAEPAVATTPETTAATSPDPTAAPASAVLPQTAESEEDEPLSSRCHASGVGGPAAAPPVNQETAEDSDSEERLPRATFLRHDSAYTLSTIPVSQDDRPLVERQKAKVPTKRPRAHPADEAEAEEPIDPGMAMAMAAAVLAAGKAGDHEAALSAFGVPITYDSPYAMARKAYLGLARLIHPDKLGSRFAGASAAFQALVKAFEAITTPTSHDSEAGTRWHPALVPCALSHQGFEPNVRTVPAPSSSSSPSPSPSPYNRTLTFTLTHNRTLSLAFALTLTLTHTHTHNRHPPHPRPHPQPHPHPPRI